MEAPVGGIAVLAGAVGAHGEAGHGGVRAVVGQPGDDGEPGPAVGAGDEGVPVAPVGRVRQFGEAVGAGGHVRGDERPGGAAAARGDDREAGAARDGDLVVVDGVHDGQRRRVRREVLAEPRDGGRGALDLGDDALGGVGDVPGEAESGGARVEVGAEADALDHAADGDPAALHRLHQRVCAAGRPCGCAWSWSCSAP